MSGGGKLPFAGPRQLILIQSGKYDYAELDLTRPFQLVGVNGLGKTALIATLQYLYLDSQRDMRFGQHSTDDSRRFYFPGDASFILFECESSLGTVTLGARGLGAIGGYELQRFAWSGSYVREDFFEKDADNKNRPRSWDEVSATLAPKGLQVFNDNAELRRLLGAVDEETSASWGLVPLAHASDYPRFRQTFQRLLQLHDLRQNDLKELLANCAKLGPSEREIELAKDFEKELARIARDRAEIALLRAAAPRVQEVRTLHDEEYVARAIAHAVTRELQDRHAGYAEWFNREIDALSAVGKRANEEHARLEREQAAMQKESMNNSERAGVRRGRLEELKRAKALYATFVREIEEQVRDRLGDEIAGLKMRLADVPQEALETLQRHSSTNKRCSLSAKPRSRGSNVFSSHGCARDCPQSTSPGSAPCSNAACWNHASTKRSPCATRRSCCDAWTLRPNAATCVPTRMTRSRSNFRRALPSRRISSAALSACRRRYASCAAQSTG